MRLHNHVYVEFLGDTCFFFFLDTCFPDVSEHSSFAIMEDDFILDLKGGLKWLNVYYIQMVRCLHLHSFSLKYLQMDHYL